MAESILREQLKRIREMTEQMARAHDDTAALSHELARDAEAAPQRHPLADVRDLRIHTSPSYKEDSPSSTDRAEAPRHHLSRDSPRRRRR